VLKAWQQETEAMRGQRSPDIHGQIAQAVAERLGVPLSKASGIINRVIFEAYPATFRPTDLLPGLLPLFERLDAAGIPRAIVSDHPSQAKLEGLGQLDGWACRVDCSAIGALKPLPDGLQAAATSMGFPLAEMLLIGDRQDSDGQMALNAGAQALVRGQDWQTGEELSEKVFALLEAP
jgi:FMN phosphatase YigB (HAD superfamily)